jgi:hypothetical protein
MKITAKFTEDITAQDILGETTLGILDLNITAEIKAEITAREISQRGDHERSTKNSQQGSQLRS